MSLIRRYFTALIVTFTLALVIWTIFELVENGFTLWRISVLVYLLLIAGTFWIRREDMVKNLSQANSTVMTPEGPNSAGNAAFETVLETIRAKGKAQRHDLLPVTGLSRSSLGRLLDQMEAQGLVRQVGDRKATYYVLPGKDG